jgi:signal transduction histidine kinase
MSIEATLREVPFFSLLSNELLDRLVGMGQVVPWEANRVVYQEGGAADNMYVILAGKVRVYKGVDDNEVELAILERGDFFGELALLDSKPREVSVTSLTACEFFILDPISFMGLLLRSRSQIVYRVFSTLASKVRDTNEKYFKQELARQALRAEVEIERHRSLAQMVAGVAHELNTPLGIANTAISIMESRVNSGEMAALLTSNASLQEILDDILEATSLTKANIIRAHKLVQNFKNISVNQLSDTKETINLPETVVGIVDLFKINARQAKLEIEIQNKLPANHQQWTGYAGYLTQIMMNFLHNIEAYAYPDGTGGQVKIIIEGYTVRMVPYFMLTVRDFGQGIPPENLSRIFDPFFTTGRGRGGTGLGMAIVYNLVTSALKGAINVDSKPGQGTTIQVTFPQVIPD